MARQSGLGRGLDSLLGTGFSDESDVLSEIDITLIDPNPDQPRKTFDQEKLAELAQSIASVGIISPILVVKTGERYMIVSGERRFRAARLADLKLVPAIIRSYDAMRRMEVALIENLQRSDLNPIEEARGIKALIDECALTQEQAATRVGKSRSAVANLLRLLTLDDATMELVSSGQLSEGHGRALLGIDDPEICVKTALDILRRGLSVRQAEELVRNLKSQPGKDDSKQPNTREPEIIEMENAFKKAIGSSVSISGTSRYGKISISYKSFDEFERIYNIIARLIEE